MNTTPQLKSFKDLAIKTPETMGLEGPKIDVNKLFGREIIVYSYLISNSKIPGIENTKCLHLQISVDGTKRVLFSSSKYLMEQLAGTTQDSFPFTTTIVKKDNNSHQFS